MLKTNNVYFASFLLARGLCVISTDVVIDKRHGKTVTFSFSCNNDEKEKELKSSYDHEEAEINIRQYLDNLVVVRSLMHNKMKRINEKTEKMGERNECNSNRRIKV
jgi:hypothetical protein